MDDPIIANERLRTIDEELLRRIRAADDPLDASCGEAFARWMLFERYPDLIKRLAPNLSARDRFYNRYFWARRFATLCEAKRGPDSGIEQQVFEILEYGADEVDADWNVIESLEDRANAIR